MILFCCHIPEKNACYILGVSTYALQNYITTLDLKSNYENFKLPPNIFWAYTLQSVDRI